MTAASIFLRLDKLLLLQQVIRIKLYYFQKLTIVTDVIKV